MTLLSRIRTLPACAPSAALLYRSERAYWLAVGFAKGRCMIEAIRRWGCT